MGKKIKRIREFYLPKLSRKANSQRLGWENTVTQLARFKAFVDRVDLNGRSLLDVGCGFGDLLSYLKDRGVDCRYTGVDIMKEMVIEAQKIHAGDRFINGDIFDDASCVKESFDFVYASGTFNINLKNGVAFIPKVIARFWECSKEGFAFNLLHERSADRDELYHYSSPDQIRPLFEGYNCELEFADDYLQNDFTVICRKINFQ